MLVLNRATESIALWSPHAYQHMAKELQAARRDGVGDGKRSQDLKLWIYNEQSVVQHTGYASNLHKDLELALNKQ